MNVSDLEIGDGGVWGEDCFVPDFPITVSLIPTPSGVREIGDNGILYTPRYSSALIRG